MYDCGTSNCGKMGQRGGRLSILDLVVEKWVKTSTVVDRKAVCKDGGQQDGEASRFEDGEDQVGDFLDSAGAVGEEIGFEDGVPGDGQQVHARQPSTAEDGAQGHRGITASEHAGGNRARSQSEKRREIEEHAFEEIKE